MLYTNYKATKFILKVLLLPALVLLLNSCDKNRVFEKNKEIKGYSWASDNKASFTVDITDTTKLYNIYVNVRHVDYYQFSNIWLITRTTFPDGKKMQQRLEIPLATDEGRWYGEGMGDIWDKSYLIQQGAHFSKRGNYIFELEQNMRKDPLPGIMAIGLRVENTNIPQSK